jgi:hypothetical protein
MSFFFGLYPLSNFVMKQTFRKPAVPPKVFTSLKNQLMERGNRRKVMFVGFSFLYLN